MPQRRGSMVIRKRRSINKPPLVHTTDLRDSSLLVWLQEESRGEERRGEEGRGGERREEKKSTEKRDTNKQPGTTNSYAKVPKVLSVQEFNEYAAPPRPGIPFFFFSSFSFFSPPLYPLSPPLYPLSPPLLFFFLIVERYGCRRQICIP